MLIAAIEIAMLVLFLIILFDAARSYSKNKKKLLLLVLALAYALIFENFNMFLSRGRVGGYFYSPEFSLQIWQTPLFVALAWACLIYTAMHLSDMLKLKTLIRPFMDALLVLSIDLTLDIVAARQGLWTWVGFSFSHGWFGVPADNFIGWMFVTLTFSFLFRYLTRKDDDMINKTTRTEYYFLLPVFAYLIMLIMFSLVNLTEDVLGLTKAEETFLLWAIVILFAAVLRTTDKVPLQIFTIDNYTIFVIIFTRILFFSYVIWSFVLMDIYMESKALVFILGLSIAAELLIYHAAFGHIGVKNEDEFRHY